MKKYYLLSFLLGMLIVGLFKAPVLTVSLACVAGILWLVADMARGFRRSQLTHAINTLPSNIGRSVNSRRYRSSAAIGTRYLFGKAGADDEHIAVVAATADKPIGLITDECAAAEAPVNVELWGVTNRTFPCVAGAAIATLNLDVYTTATGKVVGKPTAAGTYWRVGTNLTLATADGDPVEIAPQKPRKLIVLAALTNVASDIADTNSTAVNPTKADFDSLLVAAGKLQADFLLLTAAINSDADVAYATT